MQKFSISIDVSKIQKDRLRKNSFTTKDGVEVKQNLCDVVGIPLKENKLIKTGEGWKMYKTGFAVEKGGKEETTNILGDIMEFENTAEQSKNQSNTDGVDEDPLSNEDTIPF